MSRVHRPAQRERAGLIGHVDGQHVVLVARAKFADDPWIGSILIDSIEPWTLWIGAESLPAP